MEPICFIARRNFIFGNKLSTSLVKFGHSGFVSREICSIWFLEEATFMGGFTDWAMVFYSKHPVLGRALVWAGISRDVPALRTSALIPSRRSREGNVLTAVLAGSRIGSIFGLREFST